MDNILPFLIPGLLFLAIGWMIFVFVFDLLLRGFCPFIPSRPWVVDQIMAELDFKNDQPYVIALSTGRSGLLKALEAKYPNGTFIGVQHKVFPFLVSKFQTWIRSTGIQVIFSPIHRVDVRRADLVYSHLDPEEMENLGRKVKFECKPDALVISTGFNIPHLNATWEVDLPDRPGKLGWLSKNQELFKSKYKKFKKEKKAYFYRI